MPCTYHISMMLFMPIGNFFHALELSDAFGGGSSGGGSSREWFVQYFVHHPSRFFFLHHFMDRLREDMTQERRLRVGNASHSYLANFDFVAPRPPSFLTEPLRTAARTAAHAAAISHDAEKCAQTAVRSAEVAQPLALLLNADDGALSVRTDHLVFTFRGEVQDL